jgi:hypothetical protein
VSGAISACPVFLKDMGRDKHISLSYLYIYIKLNYMGVRKMDLQEVGGGR